MNQKKLGPRSRTYFPSPKYMNMITGLVVHMIINDVYCVTGRKRLTIDQCLEHRWLVRSERNSSKKLRQSLRNLKQFMARRKWQVRALSVCWCVVVASMFGETTDTPSASLPGLYLS